MERLGIWSLAAYERATGRPTLSRAFREASTALPRKSALGILLFGFATTAQTEGATLPLSPARARTHVHRLNSKLVVRRTEHFLELRGSLTLHHASKQTRVCNPNGHTNHSKQIGFIFGSFVICFFQKLNYQHKQTYPINPSASFRGKNRGLPRLWHGAHFQECQRIISVPSHVQKGATHSPLKRGTPSQNQPRTASTHAPPHSIGGLLDA